MLQDQMLMAEESFIHSNMKDDPETIYNLYKQREEIEQAFGAMRNELEKDKSYLGVMIH